MSLKLQTNCLKYSLLLVFLLFFQASFSQSGFTSLESIVAQRAKVLGDDAILMVATRDTIVYQKAGKTFNARTQAPIGHSSQWLTAALLLKLEEEGLLSLDDKVSRYLPVFEKYGKAYITIRHCLAHMTGIQAEKNIRLFDKKKFASLEEAVANYVAREIQTNPGTEFRYSPFGPAIAARVAEVVTKKKFDLLIQQKLLRPLGMRQTTFGTTDGTAPDPAMGARSTANDYIRFLRVLLNGGQLNGQQVLGAATVKALRTIQTTSELIKSAPEAARGFAYTLGAWAPAQNGQEATLLAGPSFGGTLPVVDFCRGYAFLLLPKESTEDAKANVYNEVKTVLDGQFPDKCR